MTPTREVNLSLLDVATIVMVTVIASLALWIALAGPTGPVPVHFDINGTPDRWADRDEVAAIIGGQALMLLLTSGGMGLALRRVSDPTTVRGLRLGQFISLLVIGCVTAFMAVAMLGGALPPVGFVTALVSVVLIIVGAGLGRVAPNRVVGVRTPWSFRSRRAWDRSNRLAGRLFFWLGLAGLASLPIIPGSWGVIAMGSAILLSAVWVVFESWRVWRADPEREPH